LVVVQKGLIGKLRKLLHKQLVQMLRRLGFAFVMQQYEIFPHVDVTGLIRFQLPQDKNVAKDQNRQKT